MRFISARQRMPESLLQSIERASHHVGIAVGFQYAQQFYKDGNKSAARGWLRHARTHAKAIEQDIKPEIKNMKQKYLDRMPIWL